MVIDLGPGVRSGGQCTQPNQCSASPLSTSSFYPLFILLHILPLKVPLSNLHPSHLLPPGKTCFDLAQDSRPRHPNFVDKLSADILKCTAAATTDDENDDDDDEDDDDDDHRGFEKDRARVAQYKYFSTSGFLFVEYMWMNFSLCVIDTDNVLEKPQRLTSSAVCLAIFRAGAPQANGVGAYHLAGRLRLLFFSKTPPPPSHRNN